MTMAKWRIHTIHKQEFGSIMFAEDIQLNEWTPAPNRLCSGKKTLASSLTRILLQLWEKFQSTASCSLSSVSLHIYAITQKALQMCSYWGKF